MASDDEARDYIHTYLGTSAQIDAFADEFLQLKAATQAHDHAAALAIGWPRLRSKIERAAQFEFKRTRCLCD